MFLIAEACKDNPEALALGFNPLNQVYVFNFLDWNGKKYPVDSEF